MMPLLFALLAVVVVGSLIVLVRLFVALWSRSRDAARSGARAEGSSVAAGLTETSMIERLADWIDEPYVDPDSWPDEEWSLDAPVCPCCHCIAQPGAKSCSVCDWEEPLDEDTAANERDQLLVMARERYETTGSAITTEERASWGGLLTSREAKLRSEIRKQCDHLRAGDAPDSTETLEEIGRLLAELREEEKRKHTEA